MSTALQYLGPVAPYVVAVGVLLVAVWLLLKGVAKYGSQAWALGEKVYRLFFRISEEFEEDLEAAGRRIDEHDRLHVEHVSRFDDHSGQIHDLQDEQTRLEGDQADLRTHVEHLDDRFDRQLAAQGGKIDTILAAVT